MIGSHELGSQRVFAGQGDDLGIEPTHRQEPVIESRYTPTAAPIPAKNSAIAISGPLPGATM